jgi:Sodium/hydrogen exchanger family
MKGRHTIGAAGMSTDDILLGLGLVIVLAIASRLVADRFRVPAIVLLLPVGFVAGVITDDVHPSDLFGSTFTPLVDLGVGLILFEAGLRLRFEELGAGVRGSSHSRVSPWRPRSSSGWHGGYPQCSERFWLCRAQPWCCLCLRSCGPRTGCDRF